tara:strand:- start:283 stop:762 length:480 start_codon:yes stop_codon:yes gene_type:complete
MLGLVDCRPSIKENLAMAISAALAPFAHAPVSQTPPTVRSRLLNLLQVLVLALAAALAAVAVCQLGAWTFVSLHGECAAVSVIFVDLPYSCFLSWTMLSLYVTIVKRYNRALRGLWLRRLAHGGLILALVLAASIASPTVLLAPFLVYSASNLKRCRVV